MKISDKKKFFELLGLSGEPTEAEIKQALRIKWQEWHPDLHTQIDPKKTQEEQEEEEKQKRINEEKLKQLNGLRIEYIKELQRKTSGEQNNAPYQEEQRDNFSIDDLFNDNNPYTIGSIKVERSSNSNQPEPKELLLPENDISLLNALIQAYTEGAPVGTWTIQQSVTDVRDWMPKQIYAVEKTESGEVTIFRTVKDWRKKEDRENEIIKTRIIFSQTETAPSNTFFSENILKGTSIRLQVDIPYKYLDYIQALKELAAKLAGNPQSDGSYSIREDVINTINTYGKDQQKSNFTKSDPEMLQSIKLKGFLDSISLYWQNVDAPGEQTAEGSIVVYQEDENIQPNEGNSFTKIKWNPIRFQKGNESKE